MPERLTTADWEQAALDAIVEDGLAGVAVEPLARRLGVTKGSFYWHFDDRNALIGAAIRRWERNQIDALAKARPIRDPAAELRTLVRKSVSLVDKPSIQRRLAVEAGADRRIAPALARVTAARLARIEEIYLAFGLSRARARARAALAYAVILGLEQIDREGELDVSERALVLELTHTLAP